jgi:hypothetical protein
MDKSVDVGTEREHDVTLAQDGGRRVLRERYMAVFDELWWDSKTLTLSGVDTRGIGPEVPRLNWIRWRLIDELLRRYYVDFGLEVAFGPLGVELYNDPIWSPNCAIAPRYFGRLCQNHVHSAGEHEKSYWPGIHDFLGGTGRWQEAAVWPSWRAYLRESVAVLGLSKASVPGHVACWHRRGKAVLPLVFRIALLLRTAGEIGPKTDSEGMYSYPTPVDSGVDLSEIRSIIRANGEPAEGTTPRGLFVTRDSERSWIALRADGYVMARQGNLHLREIWYEGASETEIAQAIERLAEWGNAPVAAGADETLESPGRDASSP